jgi:aspartyl/asparaginyl beta-hydroxylase (cupin superfamily)
MVAMFSANKAIEKAALFVRQQSIRGLTELEKFVVPARFSKVETTPFIDAHQFEWDKNVTSQWAKVQSELKALLAASETIPVWQEVTDEKNLPITKDDIWRTYFFYVYGHRFEKQCIECPETARLLAQIPGMKTALFSILEPGTKITPHRGPYRGVLRYQLALLVPDHGDLGIRVGDQIATWQEGLSMMFDDTYEHEAWNLSDETRVVLFLDIVRPMKFPFNVINSMIIKIIGRSPSVRQIQKRQAAWDRTLAKSSGRSARSTQTPDSLTG